MYSASYEKDESNSAHIKSFTDPTIKAEFMRLLKTENNSKDSISTKKAMPLITHDRPDENMNDDEKSLNDDEETALATVAVSSDIDRHKNQKGTLSFFDGIFKNIGIEDIILIGLIMLFLKDDNKDNDIMIPVLLFIILAF